MTYVQVDPNDLRRMAALLDEVHGDYGQLARRLSATMPAMPPWAGPRVRAEIDHASWTLTSRGNELPPVRDDLARRAAWAEIVSGFSVSVGQTPGGSSNWSWRRAVEAWRGLTNSMPSLQWKRATRSGQYLGSAITGSAPGLARSWHDTADHLSVMSGVWKIQKAIEKGAKPRSLTRYLKQMSVSKEISKGDVAFSLLGVMVDGGELGYHLSHGDVHDAAYDGGHLVFDVVSPAIPEVALAVGAFYVGEDLGKALNEQFHISEKASTAIEKDTVEAMYGTSADELSVKDATQYSHRYDGVSGFRNFAYDSGRTTINRIRGLF